MRNMEKFVDTIYLAWSPTSFGYTMPRQENPTNIYSYEFSKLLCDVRIIEGEWSNEEAMRNACLNYATIEGHDWLVVQDADEFYQAQDWHMLANYLKVAPQDIASVSTTWYQFWKHPFLVAENADKTIKSCNACFALRCNNEILFHSKRLPRIPCKMRSVLIDASCFHYGYALSDDEMYKKICTWSHSSEFNRDRWFRLKWLKWTLETKNIAPTNPSSWPRAIWFPGFQPDFVGNLFGTNLGLTSEIIRNSCNHSLENTCYDLEVLALASLRKTKKKLAIMSNFVKPVNIAH
jgi:hypothetical protein